MKKLLIGLLVLVVVILAAVVIAPFMIPVETYKEEVARRVSDATGRDFAINGEVGFSVLPRLELDVNEVTLSNAPGGRAPHMATVSELRVRLALLPLLKREIEVASFVLVDPVIHLEVNAEGRPNWQFATAKPEAAAPAREGARPAGAPAAGVADVRLGDVRLVNGTVTYFDAASGESLEVGDIDMKVSLPDLDSPLEAEGDLVWNAKEVEVEVRAERPRQLLAGESTGVAFEVEAEPVKLDYEGNLSLGEALGARGRVELAVPSVRGLAAWAGSPIEMEGSGLGPLSIAGTVGVEGTRYSFTEAELSLDSMNAQGEASVDLAGERPYVKGQLDVDRLDLNTYLPPREAEGPAGAPAETPKAEARPPQDWTDEPIDASGLHAADADLALSAGAILVQDLKIGRSALTVSLKGGKLVADLTELALYGGTAKGRLAVDGSGKVPVVAKTLALAGANARPFLKDAAGFEKLSGTANADVSVSTQGASQRAMIQALDGSGSVTFTDGAIEGINLAAMVRNVKSAFLDKSAREAQSTDFAELSGTFRIEDGILRNDDLMLLNPLLRVTGAGTVDLPQRTVNYRIEPKAAATLKGQGGEMEAKGLLVPVIVKGPWHDLTFRPDLSGIATKALERPSETVEKAKEAVEGLKEGAGGGVEGLLEGVTKPQAAEGEEEGELPVPDPKEALKGLFGQ